MVKTRLLKIRDVAEILGVNPETLRRWDNQGKLKAIRIGSRSHPKDKGVVGDRRYKKEDIEIFIKKSENPE